MTLTSLDEARVASPIVGAEKSSGRYRQPSPASPLGWNQCLEVLSSSQKEGGKPQVEAGLHDHLTYAAANNA